MKTLGNIACKRNLSGFTLVEPLVGTGLFQFSPRCCSQHWPARKKEAAERLAFQTYAKSRWIPYNRPGKQANCIYTDGHVESLPWTKARLDQFPDHVVRKPPTNPPN
jgi:prepilin-type processing-associated H-X9-DG protein